MRTRDTLALVGIFVSTIVLFTKLLQPTTFQLVVNGAVIESTSIPTVYSLVDLVTVSVASILFSVCIFSLIRPSNSLTSILKNPEHWEATQQSLVDSDEQVLYQLVMKAGGTMFQGKLVEESGFSKTKVSLVLDRLEAQRILERKRYGMSNIVQLK